MKKKIKEMNITLGFEAQGKYGYFKVCNFTNVSPK